MLNILFTQTPLKFFIESFWRDEAFSYLLAKKNIISILSFSFKDFSPPLYYILLHFWSKIFGHSEIALRLLSLIFFWLTLYVVFLFLVNVFKFETNKSLFYLSFFLINPLLNYYAYEARMYTLFSFFATLSFYLFYRKRYKPYILSVILGLYTHYFMIFVLLTQLIYSLYDHHQKRVKPLLKSFLISFIFFLPYIISIIINKQINEPFWIKTPILLSFFNIPFIIYTGYEADFSFYNKPLFLFSLIMLLIIVLSIIAILKRRSTTIDKHLFIFFSLWAFFAPVLIFIFSFYKPIFYPRYLIFASVGIILFLIYIFEKIHFKYKKVFLIIFLILTLSYNYLQIKYRTKADIRKVIKEINTVAKKDDLLYVKSELDFHTAEYYFGENRVFIYGKNYDEIPSYVGKILIPKDKLTNVLPHFPKKAFILKTDLSYDIQSDF